jgi:hypothetical protein
MANVDSIYTLYNDKLNTDKTLVNTIITAIKTLISSTADAETSNTFDFDLTSYLTALELEQQIRIKDNVIYYLRNIGFRSYMAYNSSNTPDVNSSFDFGIALNFNSEYITNSMILRIEWVVRKDTEFMKSYV